MPVYTFRHPQGKFFPACKNVFSLKETPLSFSDIFSYITRFQCSEYSLILSRKRHLELTQGTLSLSILSEDSFQLQNIYFRLKKKKKNFTWSADSVTCQNTLSIHCNSVAPIRARNRSNRTPERLTNHSTNRWLFQPAIGLAILEPGGAKSRSTTEPNVSEGWI